MATDEELLCRLWNRTLFVAYREGEITYEEALFLVRRLEFTVSIERFVPPFAIPAVMWSYDLLFEPCVNASVASGDVGDVRSGEPPQSR